MEVPFLKVINYEIVYLPFACIKSLNESLNLMHLNMLVLNVSSDFHFLLFKQIIRVFIYN